MCQSHKSVKCSGYGGASSCQPVIGGCGCITSGKHLSKKKKVEDLNCYLSKLEDKVEDVKAYIQEVETAE